MTVFSAHGNTVARIPAAEPVCVAPYLLESYNMGTDGLFHRSGGRRLLGVVTDLPHVEANMPSTVRKLRVSVPHASLSTLDKKV